MHFAERARKLGGTTIHSISDIARHQRLHDNNEESVSPADMLTQIHADSKLLAGQLRAIHEVCQRNGDVA